MYRCQGGYHIGLLDLFTFLILTEMNGISYLYQTIVDNL